MRKGEAMTEPTGVPFLRLLKQYDDLEKWGELVDALGDYQARHHPGHNWRVPPEALENRPGVIDAEHYDEEQAIEAEREVARAPKGERYHELG